MVDTLQEQPDTVWVKGTGGVPIEMTLPLHETIEEQILKGQAFVVDGPSGVPTTPAGVGVPQPRDTRPALNDRKAEWVSWAVHEGAVPEIAEGLSKDDLIEQYGQHGD